MSFGNTNATPPAAKKLANIDANQVNTNQSGIPVPYVRGRRRIALHYIAPVYNPVTTPVKTKVGKSDSQTTGYNYSGDLVGVVSVGGRQRVERLFRHIMESEIVWENTGGLAAGVNPSEPVTLKARGPTWIYWGSYDQPIDSHVLTPRGIAPGQPGGPAADPNFNAREPLTWPGANQTVQHPEP